MIAARVIVGVFFLDPIQAEAARRWARWLRERLPCPVEVEELGTSTDVEGGAPAERAEIERLVRAWRADWYVNG